MRADDLAVMTSLALFLSGLCLGWWARGVALAFVETLNEVRAWIERRRLRGEGSKRNASDWHRRRSRRDASRHPE